MTVLLVIAGCRTPNAVYGPPGTGDQTDHREPRADGATTDPTPGGPEPGPADGPADTTSDITSDTTALGVSARQETLVGAAREILETQSTVVGDVTYSYDCSGTILAIYAHAGIYLVDLFSRYTGNGVARIHGIASDYDLLHTRNLPEPGDLVFWDNTYDRNGDGVWNDPLTHAGFVLAVSEDGTVEYLHHNYRRGIVTASMNLLEPDTYRSNDGTELNSPMRMASQRASNPDLWLSSHLFREFASMHRIEIGVAGSSGPTVAASPW